MKKGRRLYKDCESTERVIRIKENAAKNKEENYSLELTRLEAVNKYLLGLEEEASTVTLKDACIKSLKYFNLEERIKKEFETLETCIENGKREVEKMKNKIRKLKVEVKMFNSLRENGEYDFDEEKWRTFVLLNEKVSLFKTEHCVNIIDEFKSFPFVKKVFYVREMMWKEFTSLGENMMISDSIRIDRDLPTGSFIYASISHQGIFGICVSRFIGGIITQFIDLNSGKEVKVKVEKDSLAGYYDNKILLLTSGKHLREATVEKVFNNPAVTTFEVIRDNSTVLPWTDVSLLHERRVLYYPTTDNRLFAFNVDTRMNTEIDIGRKVFAIASFGGIDCGIKAVFQDNNDKCIYALNTDNSVEKMGEKQNNSLRVIFPSLSNPKNMADAVFKCEYEFVKQGNRIDTSHLIKLNGRSVVRLYKDIFIACDEITKSWILIRISVP